MEDHEDSLFFQMHKNLDPFLTTSTRPFSRFLSVTRKRCAETQPRMSIHKTLLPVVIEHTFFWWQPLKNNNIHIMFSCCHSSMRSILTFLPSSCYQHFHEQPFTYRNPKCSSSRSSMCCSSKSVNFLGRPTGFSWIPRFRFRTVTYYTPSCAARALSDFKLALRIIEVIVCIMISAKQFLMWKINWRCAVVWHSEFSAPPGGIARNGDPCFFPFSPAHCHMKSCVFGWVIFRIFWFFWTTYGVERFTGCKVIGVLKITRRKNSVKSFPVALVP